MRKEGRDKRGNNERNGEKMKNKEQIVVERDKKKAKMGASGQE